MTTKSEHWMELRRDFEGLRGKQFKLIWSSEKPLNVSTYAVADSHWSWHSYPDHAAIIVIESFAARAAKTIGGNSCDDWFDEIRANKILFKLTGAGCDTVRKPDKAFTRWDSGELSNVVDASIALCSQFELPHLRRTKEEIEETLERLRGVAEITSNNMLAQLAGFSAGLLSEILKGTKSCTPNIRRKLARALKVAIKEIPF